MGKLALEFMCFLLVGLIGALLIYLSFMGFGNMQFSSAFGVQLHLSVGLVGALLKERVCILLCRGNGFVGDESFNASYLLIHGFLAPCLRLLICSSSLRKKI